MKHFTVPYHHFYIEECRRVHKCGKCSKVFQKFEKRLVISSAGNFPRYICKSCSLKLIKFIRKGFSCLT